MESGAIAAKPNWRRMQWILVALWILMFAVLAYVDIENWGNRRTPFGCAMAFFTAFAHGAWITLDLKALDHRVGAWRFGAFVFGPLVVWLYLIVMYRVRALWLIPVSVVIYLIPMLLFEAAIRILPPA